MKRRSRNTWLMGASVLGGMALTAALLGANEEKRLVEVPLGTRASIRVHVLHGWFHALVVRGAERRWSSDYDPAFLQDLEFKDDYTHWPNYGSGRKYSGRSVWPYNSYVRLAIFRVPNATTYSWYNGTESPLMEIYSYQEKPKATLSIIKFSIRIWIVATFAGVWTLSVLTKKLLSRRRKKLGLCDDCSYNLTGNTSGVCPECGTPVPPSTSAIKQESKIE